MLPPVASVASPPIHQPAPQHLGEEMAHGRTGGWLLAAETISAGQTTRPPEIIIDITSEEIRGHTSLSTALVFLANSTNIGAISEWNTGSQLAHSYRATFRQSVDFAIK